MDEVRLNLCLLFAFPFRPNLGYISLKSVKGRNTHGQPVQDRVALMLHKRQQGILEYDDQRSNLLDMNLKTDSAGPFQFGGVATLSPT